MEWFETATLAIVASRLDSQTRRLSKLIATALFFNALVVAGAAIAIYNAVKP